MPNCNTCQNESLLPVYLECTHVFCFLCVSPDKIEDVSNGLCLECSTSINSELINNDKPAQYNASLNYIWLYSSNYGNTWWCYNREHCEQVEKIYIDHCTNKQIMSGYSNNSQSINLKITKKQSTPSLQQVPSIVSFNTISSSDDDDSDSVDFSSNTITTPTTLSPSSSSTQPLSYVVNIYGSSYKLDFDNMKQVSLNDLSKKRTIMRLQIPEKIYFSSAKEIRAYLMQNNILGVSGKKF